ncbi:RNA demethylase ALKBH10B [Dendrobium catenatum]|uniref:RNA demethylase ALKBH10B n=1 Tax=Dendrobium catenatum TaxID=906689 RepID=UPI0009F17B32|nr:RNA demethylase ALKBH10B [Dendrobium catenatum]
MAVAAMAAKTPAASPAALPLSDLVARDTIIAWYRGEFAAANAIIDALCTHIVQITGVPSEYEAVFAAIHRRRLNWIPVLHMQRYFSIADVSNELRRVAGNRKPLNSTAVSEAQSDAAVTPINRDVPGTGSDVTAVEEIRRSLDEERSSGRISEGAREEHSTAYSSDCNIATEGKSVDAEFADDGGSHQALTENDQICTHHEECVTRPEKIKFFKGFVAKEPVKGHMVNVVKGLKLYEDVFTNFELHKLTEYINELRLAGRRGELSGETFIFFNKQMKGNKREIIQLGVPLFQPTNEETASSIEPIPQILLSVIDHLTQWHLIPEIKRPNSCLIHFFDEDEHSQPYFKPPHLENPISTLFLSETTIAFGRVLSSDQNGDYKGSLTLALSEGSLLVMRGNSADMARHVICPSPNKRVSVTFLKVRSATNQIELPSPASQQSKAITLWQPPQPVEVPETGPIAYGPQAMVPPWGLSLRAPVFMLAPTATRPMVMNQGRRGGRGGTGVFLPWNVGPKRYTRHLPPRFQRRRPLEAQVEKQK